MKSIKLICKKILEQAPKLAEKPVLEQVCLLRNCYDLIPPLVHRRRIKTRISGIKQIMGFAAGTQKFRSHQPPSCFFLKREESHVDRNF